MIKSLWNIIERKARLKTNSGWSHVTELKMHPITITPDRIDVQDGGLALIVDLQVDGTSDKFPWFQFHSWDEEMQHEYIRAFIGKKVEVTIKVIE